MATLTKQVFASGMLALADRFNKDLSPLVQGIYAEALSDLTAEEFEAGVKRAVTELEFYPTAKQILEFARPTVAPEIAAGHVFHLLTGDPEVRNYHPAVGTIYDLAKIRERHGEAAALAFISIGGGTRLRATSDDQMQWVLKEFRQAYAEFTREAESRDRTQRLTTGAPTAAGVTSGRYGAMPRRIGGAPQRVGQVLADVPLVGQDRAAGTAE